MKIKTVPETEFINQLFGDGVRVELDNGIEFTTQEDKPVIVLLYAILEKLEEIRWGLKDIDRHRIQ